MADAAPSVAPSASSPPNRFDTVLGALQRAQDQLDDNGIAQMVIGILVVIIAVILLAIVLAWLWNTSIPRLFASDSAVKMRKISWQTALKLMAISWILL